MGKLKQSYGPQLMAISGQIDFKKHCEAIDVFLGSFSPLPFFLFPESTVLDPQNQPVALGP